jgi:hypothetical protein
MHGVFERLNRDRVWGCIGEFECRQVFQLLLLLMVILAALALLLTLMPTTRSHHACSKQACTLQDLATVDHWLLLLLLLLACRRACQGWRVTRGCCWEGSRPLAAAAAGAAPAPALVNGH